MEHIEEAGIHSGDSACSLPPYSLSRHVIDELARQTEILAHGLQVVGLMNVQFAIKDGDIYILEVNPRASRTVPFVAKATGAPIAKVAARVMAGEKLTGFTLPGSTPAHTAVKEAVFPFNRFPGVDTILGPEMKSTGEVMGLDRDFGLAYAKAQLGAGVKLPVKGNVFISVRDRDKANAVEVGRRLMEQGFGLIATDGTARAFELAGMAVRRVNKVSQGQPHIVDAMIDDEVELVINTSEGAMAIQDSYSLRRTALVHNIPYVTTIAGARATVAAIAALARGGAGEGGLEVAPLQSYLSGTY
jgi:carbamoyl-phosphate synthase large subunit